MCIEISFDTTFSPTRSYGTNRTKIMPVLRRLKVLFFSGTTTKRGGDKSQASKKKNLLYIFCSHLIITHILNHAVGWQSRSILAGLLQYLVKNKAILVQKFWGEFVKIRFRLILRYKKVPMTTELEGDH